MIMKFVVHYAIHLENIKIIIVLISKLIDEKNKIVENKISNLKMKMKLF
jgi:hypothetical protein